VYLFTFSENILGGGFLVREWALFNIKSLVFGKIFVVRVWT